MLRDGATGRQLLHAVTEPANLIKGVEVAHVHLPAGKIRCHVPKLLHTHKRNRSLRQRRRPQPFRDSSHVLQFCCLLVHWERVKRPNAEVSDGGVAKRSRIRSTGWFGLRSHWLLKVSANVAFESLAHRKP